MEIRFLPLTAESVARAWDEYRALTLPDSPLLKFSELSKEEQLAETERAIAYRQLAVVDGQIVGWIGIRPRTAEKQIHIGFALFEEFRGRGLMNLILRRRIEDFIQNEYPALKRDFPEREIFATAAAGNLASIKTLEANAFVRTDLIPFSGESTSLFFRRRF